MSVSTSQSFVDETQRRLDDLVWAERVARSGRLGLPMPKRGVPDELSITAVPPAQAPIPLASLTPSYNVGEARAALQQVLVALGIVESELDEFEDLIGAARQRISTLSVQLERFSDLDARLISSSLDGLKSRSTDDRLPPALEQERTERGRLVDRLDLAAKSLDKLLLEQRLLQGRLETARTSANGAATAVIVAEAMPLLARIRELEAEAQRHRSVLQSFAEVWLPAIGGAPRAVVLPVEMMNLLRSPPVNANAISVPGQRTAFVNWHQRLLADPSAELEKETSHG